MKRGDAGYWEWRANTGRPKNLRSVKQLQQLCCEYFQWCDENPLPFPEMIKGGEMAGVVVEVKRMRPYTWQGLETFLSDKGVLAKLDDYRSNKENRYSEFADVIAWATNVIHDQKYSGALVGLFNGSLVSKDLNMTERSETTIVHEQPLFPDEIIPEEFE
jgi:hypothetical protein